MGHVFPSSVTHFITCTSVKETIFPTWLISAPNVEAVYLYKTLMTVYRNKMSVVQIVWNDCGAHPASYPRHTGVPSQEQSGWGVIFTIHFHIPPRLRMSEARPLLPLNALMVWTGKTFFCLPDYMVSQQ